MSYLNIYKAKPRSGNIVRTKYIDGICVTLNKNGQIRIFYKSNYKKSLHDTVTLKKHTREYDFFSTIFSLTSNRVIPIK